MIIDSGNAIMYSTHHHTQVSAALLAKISTILMGFRLEAREQTSYKLQM